MKKIIIVGLLIIFVMVNLHPIDKELTLNAQEIISRCKKEMCKSIKLEDIKTISFTINYPNSKRVPYRIFEFKRPNKFIDRGEKGQQLFDGKQTFSVIPPYSAKKIKRTYKALGPGANKHFEIEPGQFFPLFFDNETTYTGIEKINNLNYYKLKVKLPYGSILNYFIDAKTFLPTRIVIEANWEKGKVDKYLVCLSNYQEISGFMIPGKIIPKNDEKSISLGVLKSIKINPDFKEGYFKADNK